MKMNLTANKICDLISVWQPKESTTEVNVGATDSLILPNGV